jgi:hypothetical protein
MPSAELESNGPPHLVKNRGVWILPVKNPGGIVLSDLTGTWVEIDGVEYRCLGTESPAIAEPARSRLDFGVLVSAAG